MGMVPPFCASWRGRCGPPELAERIQSDGETMNPSTSLGMFIRMTQRRAFGLQEQCVASVRTVGRLCVSPEENNLY